MAILTQVNQCLQKFPYFFCEQLAVQGIGLTGKKNKIALYEYTGAIRLTCDFVTRNLSPHF